MVDDSKFGGINVVKLSSLPDYGVCMALYGAAGCGKTTLACDCAFSEHGAPIVIIDAECGTRSVRHIENGDRLSCTSWVSLVSLRDAFMQGGFQWKTIILDNMSEILSQCLRSAVGSDEPALIQHYGKATADMLSMTRSFRDIAHIHKVNVIFIAWDSVETDAYLSILRRALDFTPKLQDKFPGLIDWVGYISEAPANPRMRSLDFRLSTRTQAKFRVSPNERAREIPLVIYYGLDDHPMVDLLATAKGDVPWPKAKYEELSKKACGK